MSTTFDPTLVPTLRFSTGYKCPPCTCSAVVQFTTKWFFVSLGLCVLFYCPLYRQNSTSDVPLGKNLQGSLDWSHVSVLSTMDSRTFGNLLLKSTCIRTQPPQSPLTVFIYRNSTYIKLGVYLKAWQDFFKLVSFFF